jgi:hypothetical protein
VTKKLRRLFGRLFGGQYRVCSRKTRKYNCIAWAVGRSDAWWEAGPDGRWPEGDPDDGTVESLLRLIERLGYARSEEGRPITPEWEDGFVKVAIYADEAGWTHAARQLTGGGWTSKLGKLQDVEHETLECLTGNQYGSVVHIMKKAIPRQPDTATPV